MANGDVEGWRAIGGGTWTREIDGVRVQRRGEGDYAIVRRDGGVAGSVPDVVLARRLADHGWFGIAAIYPFPDQLGLRELLSAVDEVLGVKDALWLESVRIAGTDEDNPFTGKIHVFGADLSGERRALAWSYLDRDERLKPHAVALWSDFTPEEAYAVAVSQSIQPALFFPNTKNE